jgi:hypothetical protein
MGRYELNICGVPCKVMVVLDGDTNRYIEE